MGYRVVWMMLKRVGRSSLDGRNIEAPRSLYVDSDWAGAPDRHSMIFGEDNAELQSCPWLCSQTGNRGIELM